MYRRGGTASTGTIYTQLYTSYVYRREVEPEISGKLFNLYTAAQTVHAQNRYFEEKHRTNIYIFLNILGIALWE